MTFAAAVASTAEDAEEERRLLDKALAADEADDPDVRLEVIDFVSTSGHAAEAVELLELRLKEAPDDDFAVDLYGMAIERAYAKSARMKAPPVSAPRRTGSPTVLAWSHSRTPSASSWTAPNSARRSGCR